MSVLKYSRQRECIKNYLCNTTSHPTADTVYSNVRSQFPNISLGTVYRNLNLLVEQGEAQKIFCNDGLDHFDANCNPHYHFYCTCCKKVLDMDLPDLSLINSLAQANFDGRVTGSNVQFYGLCKDCTLKS